MRCSPSLLLLASSLALAGPAHAREPGDRAATPRERVSVDPDAGPITVVIVPDTQHEVDTHPDPSDALEFPWQLPRLERNADWICEQQGTLRIAAVLHVGDFVQAQPLGVHTQWDRVSRLLDRVEACGIPWLGAFGNHDCVGGPNGCDLAAGGERGANFQRFVAEREAAQPEWQAAGPEMRPEHGACGLGGAPHAPSRIGWIRFAERFAALSLDWYPGCASQEEWARSVVAENDLRFLLLGHAIAGTGDSPACAAPAEPGQGPRVARIAGAGGVFAVVGGHYVFDPSFACYGTSQLEGRRVLSLFSDFQTNAGTHMAGTLVLLRIDVRAAPGSDNACVRQYNPSLDRYDVTEPERCFELPALR